MAKKSKHYKITNWKGHRNYECNYCLFATINRSEFAQHLDVHMRTGLVAVEETAAEPFDENYGLDLDPKAAKGAEKQAAKQTTRAAAKAAKESKHG